MSAEAVMARSVSMRERRAVRTLALKVGGAVAVAASGLAVYAAYGDRHPKSNQEAAVPFLAGIDMLLAVLVFGLVVPRLLSAIAAADPRSGRNAVWCGVAALVSTVAFWSGAPLVLGGAAVLLGMQGRKGDTHSRRFAATLILGVLAVLFGVAMTVLGGTVLAQ